MVRRRIAEQPTSRLAIWARRFALFSLLASLLIVIIVRIGFLEIEPALASLGGALLFSVAAVLLALGAFVVIWRQGIGGLGLAFTAIAIGGALLAYPAYLGALAAQLPAISDITTDLTDPPRFDVIARLRPRGTVDYGGPALAARQRAAYPDIAPLSVSATPQIAFEVASGVIVKRKWRVVVDRAPQAGRRDGLIEAVARSPVLGFRDDVALRIRPAPDGARIDVRSASRYGTHDLGTNAARVRALLEEIDTAVTARLERPAPRPTAPPAPTTKPAPTAKR